MDVLEFVIDDVIFFHEGLENDVEPLVKLKTNKPMTYAELRQVANLIEVFVELTEE